MKVAIVHDWLTVYGGAERVLTKMLQIFPQASLFAVLDTFSQENRCLIFNKKAKTTFLQHFPFLKKFYRYYSFLMPLAIEQLDLEHYDLVISLSHCVAKGVLTHPDQKHLCYCFSPMRYAWDLQKYYFTDSFLKNICLRLLLHNLRRWDVISSSRPDKYLTISNFVKKRIMKIYRRPADVIYPFVQIPSFQCCFDKEDFYLIVSRLVPYKGIELAIRTFKQLPDKKLVIIGDGPNKQRLQKIASSNIKFLGYLKSKLVKKYMQKAKCFLFLAIEDFGIASLEAQACGTPVIAINKGAAPEIIQGISSSSPTGLFFQNLEVNDLKEAILTFENHRLVFNPLTCRQNAERFSEEIFEEKIIQNINEFVFL